MARLEVVDIQACDLVYVLQLQHVLPVLVPLLHLQSPGTCGAQSVPEAARPVPQPPSHHSQHTATSRACTHTDRDGDMTEVMSPVRDPALLPPPRPLQLGLPPYTPGPRRW